MRILRTLTRVSFLGALLLFQGCASLSTAVKTPPLSNQRDIFYLENVPPVAQRAYQCGPAALESVMRYWGKDADADAIGREIFRPGTRGVLNFMLPRYAKDRGFWTQTPKADEEQLKVFIRKGIPPVAMLRTGVLWVEGYHFVVLKGFNDSEGVFYANTGEAETQAISYPLFRDRWNAAGRWCLVVSPAERVDWELDPIEANELARLFEKRGDLDRAAKGYEDASRKDPQNEAIRFNLATLYLKKRQFEEARSIYTELLKKKPGWGAAANNLAWIYLEEKKDREAAQTIETAFQNGAARDFDILDTLGLASCRLGDKTRAQELFSEATAKVPAGDSRALASIQAHLAECGLASN